MKSIEMTQVVYVPDAPSIQDLVFRKFQAESDYAVMSVILMGCREADQIEELGTAEDIAHYFNHVPNSDPYQNAIFAEVDGQAIGYCYVRWFQQTDGTYVYKHKGYLLPAWRRKGIGRALLHYGEQRLREIAAAHTHNAGYYFESAVFDTEYGAEAMLKNEGYSPARHFYLMVRPDLENIPEAPMPPGLDVRSARPEHYQQICEAANEAFQDHWGYSPDFDMTVEKLIDHKNFDPSLWRVAWDGDQVAGMVMSYINREENDAYNRLRGWTEDISVRRPWRKRGLARSLLAQSLYALKERGMREAALGVDTENLTGALHLYESLGFRSVKRTSMFQKSMTNQVPNGSEGALG